MAKLQLTGELRTLGTGDSHKLAQPYCMHSLYAWDEPAQIVSSFLACTELSRQKDKVMQCMPVKLLGPWNLSNNA